MARASRAEWVKRVEMWKRSGLTAKAFATAHGLNASSLSCWSWKLRAEERKEAAAPRRKVGASGEPTMFVELPIAGARQPLPSEPTRDPATLELQLADGVRVRVPSGFDEATLKRIVRTLAGGR